MDLLSLPKTPSELMIWVVAALMLGNLSFIVYYGKQFVNRLERVEKNGVAHDKKDDHRHDRHDRMIEKLCDLTKGKDNEVEFVRES